MLRHVNFDVLATPDSKSGEQNYIFQLPLRVTAMPTWIIIQTPLMYFPVK